MKYSQIYSQRNECHISFYVRSAIRIAVSSNDVFGSEEVVAILHRWKQKHNYKRYKAETLLQFNCFFLLSLQR